MLFMLDNATIILFLIDEISDFSFQRCFGFKVLICKCKYLFWFEGIVFR